MNKLIEFFIKHPIWANALIVLTLVFGSISFYKMDRSFFPELEPTVVTVSTFYPGASPSEMEEGITIKIEEALKGISEIDELKSTSMENSSVVTVTALQGTDMDNLLQEVKNAVDGISSFPAGAEKPIIFRLKSTGMAGRAAFISLVGLDDPMLLKNTAEEIERDFLNSGIISDIEIKGYPDIEYSIEVRENVLRQYGLTFDNIVAAIRMNNRDISAGKIKTKSEELIIRSNSKTTDVFELENIVLKSGNMGQYVRLGEVANIYFKFADVPNKSYLDGQRNVTFEIKKRYGEDLREISEFINTYVADFNAEHEDVELIKTFMFYDMLNQRIDLLSKNGLTGLILVLIVLGLFLNLRLSLWVAFGIPFSFLGMFIIGSFYGMTINMISLFGMILVVGILVDDGIVIAENIYSHFERGKTPFRAAVDGTLEVINAVFTSVLTTIVAFSVLFFIEGMEQMAEMAFVVIAALAFSLVEAFLVLPSHLGSNKVLKTNVLGKFRTKIVSFIEYLRDDVYGVLLDMMLKYRRVTVFFPLLFIIFVFGLTFKTNLIRTTFFPSIPFDDFTVEVAFKPGEREEYTEAFLRNCLERINVVQEELREEYDRNVIKYTSLNIGFTRNIGETGSHAGHISVSLDVEGLPISSFDIARRVREKIGEVRGVEKYAVGGINRWGKPVSIALQGKDMTQLKEAKSFFVSALQAMPELKDVQDNSSTGKREVLLTLKPRAYMLGLSQGEISRQIRQGFFGEEVQRLIVGTDEARVWVRYPDSDRYSLGHLEQMKIRTQAGLEVPLVELVDYEIERGEVSIKHYDGIREIEVSSDLTDPYADTPQILAKIKSEIYPALKMRYPNIEINDNRGQQRRANKSTGSMQLLMLVLLFLMVLIITLNFNSLLQGFIIVSILPVGIASSMLGHGIENKPVSILSAWGIIALMGVLVNDAVVFLDKYNTNLKAGLKVKDAARNAGLSRFRPIIMTSITTVAGLFPLIREKSFQAQFLVPMAISVAYGVLFGTYFILVFFPSLILIFNDIKRFFRMVWTGVKPSPEEVEPCLEEIKHIDEISHL